MKRPSEAFFQKIQIEIVDQIAVQMIYNLTTSVRRTQRRVEPILYFPETYHLENPFPLNVYIQLTVIL